MGVPLPLGHRWPYSARTKPARVAMMRYRPAGTVANTKAPSVVVTATYGADDPAPTGSNATFAFATGSLVPQRTTRPCNEDETGCAAAIGLTIDADTTTSARATFETALVIGPPARSARPIHSCLHAGERNVRVPRTRA